MIVHLGSAGAELDGSEELALGASPSPNAFLSG